MREPARRKRTARGRGVADGKSLPAPTGGWDAVSPLAAMKPDRAIVLDNWFPTPTDVRVRRGYQYYAVGMGEGPVESLLVYHGNTSSTSKLFAATGGAIYDVTSGGSGSLAVSGLNNNRWQSVNFTTPGGKFLWICNGTDAPRHFNGTTWATPTLTGTGVTAEDIVNVNAHKNRLWFVFKDSTSAGYLATGAIAGTVTKFDLGGLFTKGGHLVAMGTWTRDGGAGEDDLAVFISSQGQCAVYAGTDPSNASTWALVGVYDLGPPMGYRCFTKVAGDLALVNIDGVLPLSRGLQQDRGAAAEIAITARINNAMNAAARQYKNNFGWELMPYPKGTYVLLNVPLRENAEQHQYVMNTLTGAWCRFTNQNANCWAVFRDDLYFGGNDGAVYKADQTGLDVYSAIDARGQTAYSYYDAPGIQKQWKLIQPVMTTDAETRPSVGLSTDFRENAVLGTPSVAQSLDAKYDSAVWDEAVYAAEHRTTADWASISGEGYCASIHFRAQTGRQTGVALWGRARWGQDVWSESISGDVTMRLNGFQVVYEKGFVL